MSLFGDYKFDGGQLVARETGAEIPLTGGFVKEAWKILSFVWLINALRATRVVKGREPRARISFFPRKPRSYYAIWPVCQLADVKIVDDPLDADFHFYFEDRDFLIAPPTMPTARPAYNVGCYDIRKSVVTRIFEETFGYALSIDPTTHVGDVVEKSDSNGKHDGRIVACPIDKPKRGVVYQKVVDNTFDGQEHVDIRTPIVGNAIPFVYLKKRQIEHRFSNQNDSVDLVDTDVVLSRCEQKQILEFARAIGLDFGALDVLRDRNNGRIYIVDANKTDMGPPAAMSGHDKLQAMRGLASAFASMVDDTIAA